MKRAIKGGDMNNDNSLEGGKSHILSLSNVSFAFPSVRHFSLRISHFELLAGERVLLLGPSGSGKSTMLNLLSGVLRPTQGDILFRGKSLGSLSTYQLDRFRGDHVGLIHQTFNLIPWLSAGDNIALGLAFSPPRARRLTSSTEAEIDRLLNALGLPPDLYSKQKASQLSIGQQQRVGAARALIGQPEIILADEPTSALDLATTQEFMKLLIGSLEPERQALLMVSHDERLADYFTRTIDITEILEAN